MMCWYSDLLDKKESQSVNKDQDTDLTDLLS